MKSAVNKRKIHTVVSLFLLFTGFLMCRYVLLGLHGMKEFPELLFCFGLIIIGIAAIFNGQKIMLCTAAGYSIGFLLGFLFQSERRGSGGYMVNTMWEVWALTMLGCVFIGIVWEILSKAIRNHSRKKEVSP